MQTEIECKFLNVDFDEVRKHLKAAGAVCDQPMRMMRRKTYDYSDNRLSNEYNGWVRVRDEGDKITLSYKQLNDRTLHGTKEITLTVSDFATADSFLLAIGLEQKSYQETKRESWHLGDAQIELDEWPWIKPTIEIEGPNETAVRETAEKLGFRFEDALFGSVEVAYQAEYDVTEDEIDEWEVVTFTPVPDWLEPKRRKAVA
jgi:adenylate cyclase, class 2